MREVAVSERVKAEYVKLDVELSGTLTDGDGEQTTRWALDDVEVVEEVLEDGGFRVVVTARRRVGMFESRVSGAGVRDSGRGYGEGGVVSGYDNFSSSGRRPRHVGVVTGDGRSSFSELLEKPGGG